jgi:hypothetical protein
MNCPDGAGWRAVDHSSGRASMGPWVEATVEGYGESLRVASVYVRHTGALMDPAYLDKAAARDRR